MTDRERQLIDRMKERLKPFKTLQEYVDAGGGVRHSVALYKCLPSEKVRTKNGKKLISS